MLSGAPLCVTFCLRHPHRQQRQQQRRHSREATAPQPRWLTG
jgi:hypothetical protein